MQVRVRWRTRNGAVGDGQHVPEAIEHPETCGDIAQGVAGDRIDLQRALQVVERFVVAVHLRKRMADVGETGDCAWVKQRGFLPGVDGLRDAPQLGQRIAARLPGVGGFGIGRHHRIECL